MRSFARVLPLLFLSTLHFCARAQTSDTLEWARSVAYSKDFALAGSLLETYNAKHEDPDAQLLQAQVLYWMKDFDGALRVYQKALELFPSAKILQLEYGRTLYNLGKFSAAKAMLRSYVKSGPGNPDALVMLAYLDLWSGHTAAAKKQAAAILNVDTSNADAMHILHQVAMYRAPYIQTGIARTSDDQPRKGLTTRGEFGFYSSWLLSPVLRVESFRFKANDSSYNALWTHFSNTVHTGGFCFELGAGLFRHNSGSGHLTGKLALTQVVAKHFSFAAAYERLPYQYSVRSLESAVMQKNASVSIGYNEKDKWLAKAALQQQQFGSNHINTSYAWLLAPLIHNSRFWLNAGYGFSFANADANTFYPRDSFSRVVTTTPVHGVVEGEYDPYFTPQNQIVHSALASLRVNFSSSASLRSQLSVGVFAQADNPHLTLERKANQMVIQKTYAPTRYTPVSWVTELQFGLSKRLFAGGSYSFDKLLFYTASEGNLHLKYLFLK